MGNECFSKVALNHRILVVAFACLIPTPELFCTGNRVTLKAVATDEYLERRALSDAPEIQTYQFLEGKRFGGKGASKSLANMTFKELAVDLAENLVKQNFYPNPELGKGDLLIVVHYGATDFEEDMMELLGSANEADLMGLNPGGVEVGSASSADVTAMLDVLDNIAATASLSEAINSGNSLSRSQKAHILGIDEERDLPDFMSGDYEYEQMLQESRYFVVLMAFDYQLYMQEGESKLLWSTRYNVRSAGQSFQAAIEGMNAIGSDYFGKNLDKLARKRIEDTSSVEIGDIEVIEEAGNETN